MNLENVKANLAILKTYDFEDDFIGISFSNEKFTNYNEINSFFKVNQDLFENDDYFYRTELKKYKQDIALIKQSGISNFRFTLSWAKIIPDGIGEINSEAIAFYNQIFKICRENGVEPFVSLYESNLPLELQKLGGWANRESINWFESYVGICATLFKEKVTYWIIFNEPSVFTGASGFFDIYPSGKNKINIFLSVLHHTLLCQSIGYNKIKQIDEHSRVGTFYSCNYSVPMTYSEKDLKATERIDAFLNRIFIEPSLGMGYPIKTLPFLKSISKYLLAGDDELIKVDFDFIGLQNCTQEIVCHNAFIPYLNAKILDYDNLRIKKKYLFVENYQELMYNVVKKYSEYEGIKKIIIDENLSLLNQQIDTNTSPEIKNNYNIQSFYNI